MEIHKCTSIYQNRDKKLKNRLKKTLRHKLVSILVHTNDLELSTLFSFYRYINANLGQNEIRTHAILNK